MPSSQLTIPAVGRPSKYTGLHKKTIIKYKRRHRGMGAQSGRTAGARTPVIIKDGVRITDQAQVREAIAAMTDISFAENITLRRETTCKTCGKNFDSTDQPGTLRECPHCGSAWGSK